MSKQKKKFSKVKREVKRKKVGIGLSKEYKIISKKSYRSKSANELFRDVEKKLTKKDKAKFKKNPAKYIKSLRQVAHKNKIRTSADRSVTIDTIENVKLERNTQLFVEYKNAKGEYQLISKLILSDDKRRQKKLKGELIEIARRYKKNKITKVFTKKLDFENREMIIKPGKQVFEGGLIKSEKKVKKRKTKKSK